MASGVRPTISRYWVFVPGTGSDYWRSSTDESMHLGYDIYRKLADGSALWIAQAPSLSEARQKLDTLVSIVPADYFVREASTGRILATVIDGQLAG